MAVRLFKNEEEASVGTGLDLDSTYWRLRFQVLGWDDPEDAINELTSDPTCPTDTMFMGKKVYRQPVTVRLLGYKLWESDVLYTARNPNEFQVTVTGRTTGGTQKIQASYGTIGKFVPQGQTATDYGGLIGYDPKKRETEGAEIIIPRMELDLEVTYPVGYANSTYLGALADLTGSVNGASWGGWQAGQVLYMGAEFSKGNQEPTKITHHVGIERNLENVTLAGIPHINKEGWDYLWFVTVKDDTGKLPTVKAQQANVERVYPRANFTTVLGFSKVL